MHSLGERKKMRQAIGLIKKNCQNKQQNLVYLKLDYDQSNTETAFGKHGHADVVAVLSKIKILEQRHPAV